MVCLLRGHFCYEELAILWVRILQDPSFLSKAGLGGWDVFLPSCAHHCLLSASLLLGAGPAWTAGRASHACAEQSVAPPLSVLRVSPSLKPECVSLCTRTHGWHFCWKEECKFTCMKLLCPHQALPVVRKHSYECRWTPGKSFFKRTMVTTPWFSLEVAPALLKDTWSREEGSHPVSSHCSALSYTYCLPK